jgi:hypothetical protein
MAAAALKYLFCRIAHLRTHGASNSKKRCACNNLPLSHKIFYAEYTYNACNHGERKT